jgi:hypothetical protein
MSTGYNIHAREERRSARRRAWRFAELSGLVILAATTLVVVFLALSRQY